MTESQYLMIYVEKKTASRLRKEAKVDGIGAGRIAEKALEVYWKIRDGKLGLVEKVNVPLKKED